MGCPVDWHMENVEKAPGPYIGMCPFPCFHPASQLLKYGGLLDAGWL